MSLSNDMSEERPGSVQHTFRISLNQTRRIVRRLIELDQTGSPVWQPAPPKTCVPDRADFQFSLRMLRRIMHRLLTQAGVPDHP
jgi:hypothetical protein